MNLNFVFFSAGLLISLALQMGFERLVGRHTPHPKRLLLAHLLAGSVNFVVSAYLTIRTFSAIHYMPFSLDALRIYGHVYAILLYLTYAGLLGAVMIVVWRRIPRFLSLLRRPFSRLAHLYDPVPAASTAGSTDAPTPKKRPLPVFWRIFCAVFLIGGLVCLAELFVFNARHYTPARNGLSTSYYPPSSFASYEGGEIDEYGLFVVGEEGAKIEILCETEIVSVSFDATVREKAFDFSVGMQDESSQYEPRVSPSYQAHAQVDRSCNVNLRSNGTARVVQLRFFSNAAGLQLHEIKLNEPIEFQFSIERFLFLSIVLFGIYLIRFFQLYRVSYNSKNSMHQAALLGCLILLCAALFYTFFTTLPNSGDEEEKKTLIDIPYSIESLSNDAYYQMFDAMMKKQLHLDIPVDEKLELLENPYDPSARNNGQVSYAWDRAYYNGKYYSYFGLAPLVTVVTPYYLIFNRIPTSITTCFIECFIFLFALYGLVRELLKSYHKRIPLLLALAGFITAAMCANVFWAMRRPDYYEVAAIAGITWCTMFLFLLLRGLRSKGVRRYLLLFGSGVACVLVAMSRPNMLLYASVAALLLFWLIFDGKLTIHNKVFSLLSIAVPILIGAAFLCWYNYARFGSPFEFGATYQMTVSDIRYNTITNPLNLLAGLFHYFLQPPYLSASLPFVGVSFYPAVFTGNYYFLNSSLGILFYPVSLFCFALPFLKNDRPKRLSGNLALPFAKTVTLCGFVMLFLVFSTAGVLYRYTIDFYGMLILGGIVAAWQLISVTNKHRRLLIGVAGSLMLLSTLVACMLTLMGESNTFMNQHPKEFVELRMMLEWWR